MAHRLTGSRMGIAYHCGWAFDPSNEYPEPPPSDVPHLGSALHDCAAWHVTSKEPTPIEQFSKQHDVDNAELAELYASFVSKYESMPRPNAQAELALAWHPERGGRILGRDIGRDYEKAGCKPDEYPCSLDLVYQASEDEQLWVVADYKTGRADVPEPEENHQLLFGALCLYKALQHAEVAVERIRLEIWKVRPDRTWVDATILNRLQLVDLERQFEEIVGRIEGDKAMAGDHCQWCPALGSCPATSSALAELDRSDATFPWTLDIQNAQHAGWMAQNIGPLSKAVDTLKKQLQAYAEEKCGGQLTLPNGRVYKCCPFKRASLNKKALEERVGAELIAQCTHQIEVSPWKIVKAK